MQCIHAASVVSNNVDFVQVKQLFCCHCFKSLTHSQCFKSRPTLVSLSNSDQWGGDLPLPSGPSLSEHVGNPLWDEMRSRVQTAGEALDQLSRQPTLVWDYFLPQYVEFQTAALTAVFPQWCLHRLHNTVIILLLWHAYAAPVRHIVGLILMLLWLVWLAEQIACVVTFPQKCVATYCTSSHMADTPAPMALKWTPGVTSPVTPAIALTGNTHVHVNTGVHGVERSQCVQVHIHVFPSAAGGLVESSTDAAFSSFQQVPWCLRFQINLRRCCLQTAVKSFGFWGNILLLSSQIQATCVPALFFIILS